MKKIMFLFCCYLSICCSSFAAIDTVIVNKDPRLDVLTSKQIMLNKRATMLTSTGKFKGFRIQVVSVSNKDQAFKSKADLLTRFPQEKSYVVFQSPYFKVRIGNFIRREDADKFRKTYLTKLFPNGVFIVEDEIEYTPPPEEETTQ